MKWLSPARVALFMLLLAVSAFAQSASEGSVEGTVTDPSGAVVVGATLEARNLDTSAKYATTTDERGYFRFLILPVGSYEIVAEHSGFASLIQKDVVITVGARINLPLTLSLPSQTQRIVVSGETPIVETTRSQVSSTVTSNSGAVTLKAFLPFATHQVTRLHVGHCHTVTKSVCSPG